ncbi:hypothetical protein A3D77_06590 [Candidatus Gottesmanbacteria bacterium RIFCSPHIGHO2_02_FULL_39_11]|uniref:DUF5678 domain-containing protein n=1 Tax=Candidatus Gottesmanbacteria bacterium RIFCSPHIGHO2_02_FULL_39_11 TaxID=1798382 RepID=A0A1F5ZSQ8_9BACT|nr:MAG: hypothetical protein A3D77_06590 [Candidatus Gottesmanbacteria bacterium RIFCSPHIGHO2_02_FULL_39_11]
MKKKTLKSLIKPYSSGWISVASDYTKVIAWEKSLPSLIKKLKELKNPNGVMMNIASDYSQYAG